MDETARGRAISVAEAVSPYVDAVKINWPLVLSAGPGMISRGASAVIVHAFTGRDSLETAVAAAGDADIYAVTEMSHPGGSTFTSAHAEEMAAMGVECGVAGFIAPATRPERIAAVRSLVGDLKILSPGAGAQGGSAAAAVSAGADYVIVGRAIYGSEDPEGSAASFAREISTASRGAL